MSDTVLKINKFHNSDEACATFAPALPPAVRYRLENQSVPQQRRSLCDFRSGFAARCEARLCLAVAGSFRLWGFAPGTAFGRKTWAKPEPWAEPNVEKQVVRQGIALPHIGRRSRSESRTSFVAVVGLIDFHDGISHRAAKPERKSHKLRRCCGTD